MSLNSGEYVKRSGAHCPNCESANIEADGDINSDGDWMSSQIHCNDCGADWEDVYTLSGYETLTNVDTDMARIAKVRSLAAKSAFYKNDDGVFRINAVPESDPEFHVEDEESGEMHVVEMLDVKPTDVFMALFEESVG